MTLVTAIRKQHVATFFLWPVLTVRDGFSFGRFMIAVALLVTTGTGIAVRGGHTLAVKFLLSPPQVVTSRATIDGSDYRYAVSS